VDLDGDDLASMVDTIYDASESSSNSLSDSDSKTPLDDPPAQEDYEEDYPDSEPMAPPDDMVMELSEEDPDPVMDDTNMPDSTTISLLSVGVQQQTLGVGPPMAPLQNPPTRVLLWQTWAGGHKPQQLVPHDLPIPVLALTIASVITMNPSTNEVPAPTITNLLHGVGTGTGGFTPPIPSTCTPHPPQIPVFQHIPLHLPTSLHQTTLSPLQGRWQVPIFHSTTNITQNIVPLTFPHEQATRPYLSCLL